ncbi:MAG TPA: biopolymer transporter ExbD [Pirellulaceae bacterium]|jgi:biopolymer transport protein ExbD
MRKQRGRSGLSAEPNLTPILDMVFQLITFFMLVISFKTAAIDTSVRLPVVGSAQPKQGESERNFAVLNIDANGNLRVFGEACDLEKFLSEEAVHLRKAAVTDGSVGREAGSLDADLALAAVIRADRATSFGEMNRILAACKAHGFRNVTFKVLEAESE